MSADQPRRVYVNGDYDPDRSPVLCTPHREHFARANPDAELALGEPGEDCEYCTGVYIR